MSDFVLDASYTLTWCFPNRATPNTDATLKRLEARIDSALVPWVWQLEIGNALGKAVVRGKVPLAKALELWDELALLPIRQGNVVNVPELLQLSVRHNLSIYDACYLQAALEAQLPLATNDEKLRKAAEVSGVVVFGL